MKKALLVGLVLFPTLASPLPLFDPITSHPRVIGCNRSKVWAAHHNDALIIRATINNLNVWNLETQVVGFQTVKNSAENIWIVRAPVRKSQLPALLDQPFVISVQIEENGWLG